MLKLELKIFNHENLINKFKKSFGIKYVDKKNITNNYICNLKTNKSFYINKTLIKNHISNYYINDSFSKASKNMQECSNVFLKNKYSYL